MHELNISSPLRLARFFSTQQLFHKNPKLKNKILVYIFLYQTPVMPETFFYLEKENLGYVRTHTPFFALWIRFRYLRCSKARNMWGPRPYHHRDKLSFALINDWENAIVYGKNPSKARPRLLAIVIRLGAQPQPDSRSPHFYLETVFPALKLTQSCYLHYNVNIFLENC